MATTYSQADIFLGSGTKFLSSTSNTVMTADGGTNVDLLFNAKGSGVVGQSRAVVGGAVTLENINSDNTNSASQALILAKSGGTSGGNSVFQVSNTSKVYSLGLDNSSSNKNFVLSNSATLGTSNMLSFDGTSNIATFANGFTSSAGNLDLINSVNNSSGAALLFDKNRAGSAVTSLDDLGDVTWRGFDGTSNISSALIHAVVDSNGTVATNRIPTQLQFFTHPDSTSSVRQRMFIDMNGQMTVNAPDSGVGLTVNGSLFDVVDSAADTSGATHEFKKNRAGGAIVTGDTIGICSFQGFDGSNYVVSSQIISVSSGTIAAGRVASDLEFWTHPDSGTSSTLRMSIASTGAVTIAAPDSGVGLTVAAGGITLTAGSVTVSNGDVVISTATKGVTLPGGQRVISGTGSPNGSVTAVKGSLYLNATGSGVADRAFINTDGGTTWTAITTVA